VRPRRAGDEGRARHGGSVRATLRQVSTRPTTRVSLVALPEAMPSTLIGLHDVLSSVGGLPTLDRPIDPAPFQVEIVAERAGPMSLVTGVPVTAARAVADVASTDIVLVPSILAAGGRWDPGRYPELVDWIAGMHAGGALLASACSGLFPLAETGLLDGREATIHWDYARGFRDTFPRVALDPEKVLVVSGDRSDIVTSGASSSWGDLALYLVARRVGATVAQAAARFFAFQWHVDGLAAYALFRPRTDHGDAVIADVQGWIEGNRAVARPVEEMRARSGLAERTFVRRFTAATGLSPIAYVQRLRVEDAKRRLERTDTPVERIAWEVGYEDPAAFRRLFRRITGLAPGAYRRRFQVPAFAQPPR
jgi:transcriptional regulator GlxA family with amidase domain